MVVMMAGICMISNFNVVASVSRLVWQFARDKGLPYNEYFTYVSILDWAYSAVVQQAVNLCQWLVRPNILIHDQTAPCVEGRLTQKSRFIQHCKFRYQLCSWWVLFAAYCPSSTSAQQLPSTP